MQLSSSCSQRPVCSLYTLKTNRRPLPTRLFLPMALRFDKVSAAPIRRQAGSDTACLLLHGLTGAPARDLWFLADYLSARGISVVAPLLTGHGKTWKELELSLIHISEPTRLGMISYAVFCLKKKNKKKKT